MAEGRPADEKAEPGRGEAAAQPGVNPTSFDSHPADAPSASSREAPFGAALIEPILRQTCNGRLSPISWFRTDWQRGGALTGYATYECDDGVRRDAVVKMPVPPSERSWLLRFEPFPDLVPKLYAHGETLNGYDLAWIVMERLPHGPLGQAWSGKEFDLMIEAAGRFYAAAHGFPIDRSRPSRDWESLLHQSRDHIQSHDVANEQRWKTALREVHRKLKEWHRTWSLWPADHWCHGDLHLGNAMTRRPAPDGPAVLFDLAEVHVGHWIDDAVYFEHLYWARPHKLDGRKLCTQIARERKTPGIKRSNPIGRGTPRSAGRRCWR